MDVEPSADFWREAATYDQVLQHEFIAPLAQAHTQPGGAPLALQLALLQRVQWYFSVDQRERAPTLHVTEPMAARFHAHIGEFMRRISPAALQALQATPWVSAEVCCALRAYQAGPAWHSAVQLDARDVEQGLVRLSYYVHGQPPSEGFQVDGVPAQPVYAKYRACRFFQRTLVQQRLLWLAAPDSANLSVTLAGAPVPVHVSAAPAAGVSVLPSSGWRGYKVRLLRALAAWAPVRAYFANAWVFADRNEDADDNAEHLYRWVRRHHPELNVWFLLDHDAPDWPRLAAEGFRLVAPGLRRKLLLLNAAEVVSSQPGPAQGSERRWRFTYLRHGVQMNDMSHWLNQQSIDRLITLSPAEYAAVVADDTPYMLTTKETRLTGLPRHDALRALAYSQPRAPVDTLLIFPTWRAGLVDTRAQGLSSAQRMARFAAGDYAQHWAELLNSEPLRVQAARSGLRLVFMPHPNAAPYLSAFCVPDHVTVLTKAQTRIQPLLCRTAVMLTDYSSIVFEMAYLRRPVLYYQFDRAQFFGGAHNWRPGYFDFERDGFGPVAQQQSELLTELARVLNTAPTPAPLYRARMERAVAQTDGQSCRRVFDSIVALHHSAQVPVPLSKDQLSLNGFKAVPN